MLHVFHKPNGLTTKCGGSKFKDFPWDPDGPGNFTGNFTTKCLALENSQFQTNFYLHPWARVLFSTKCHVLAKLKWTLDLFQKWPQYKVTYKRPFCSGLEATHSVWEIGWGMRRQDLKRSRRSDRMGIPGRGGC